MSRRDAVCSPMEARTADLKRLVLLELVGVALIHTQVYIGP